MVRNNVFISARFVSTIYILIDIKQDLFDLQIFF